MKRHWNPATALLIYVIRGYQILVSPVLPRSCKYYPSCSQYALDALRQYGVLRGVVLAGWRLLRCNPLSYGGYDPVERQTLFATQTKGAGSSCCSDGDPASPPGCGEGLSVEHVVGC